MPSWLSQQTHNPGIRVPTYKAFFGVCVCEILIQWDRRSSHPGFLRTFAWQRAPLPWMQTGLHVSSVCTNTASYQPCYSQPFGWSWSFQWMQLSCSASKGFLRQMKQQHLLCNWSLVFTDWWKCYAMCVVVHALPPCFHFLTDSKNKKNWGFCAMRHSALD